MYLETIEIWVDALEDATIGLNSQLVDIPLRAGDSRPPDIVSFHDVTDDDDAFEGRLPAEWPAGIISPEGIAADADGEVSIDQEYRDARGVRVRTDLISGRAELGDAMRDLFYYQRAMLRTLAALMDNDNASRRTVRSVNVRICTDLQIGELLVDEDNGRVINATVTEFQVRDLAPYRP